MKTISLTQGCVAIVDDADYDLVSQFKWHAQKGRNGCFYASRNVGQGKQRRQQHMHVFLINPPDGYFVDHEDTNGLNNQRGNLRTCSCQQNNWHAKLNLNSASGFKGVHWFKPKQIWMSRIGFNNKRVFLGYFENKLDAAKAYDEAALKYHGAFALTNKQLGLVPCSA